VAAIEDSGEAGSSTYLPRTLYGEYLLDQFTSAVEEAASLGVKVLPVFGE